MFARTDSPLIEEDSTGYFRLYEDGHRSFMWDLVKFPPSKKPKGGPPHDWYIGACNNTTDNCFQHIVFREIFFQYKLDTLDLPVHKEVADALRELFQGWESTCPSVVKSARGKGIHGPHE